MRAAPWILMTAVAVMAGCAKIVVVKVDEHTQPAAGVFYALPRTVIGVQLKVDRKEPKGKDVPFMAFADIFAPGADTACSDRDCADDVPTYALKDGVSLSTYGEPDGNHVYMVKFANGRAVDQTLNLTWNELGLASTVSASVTNRTTDIAMSALKVAAGIGTRAAFGATEAKADEPPTCMDSITNDAWVIDVLRNTVPTANGDVSMTLVANYCDLQKSRRETMTETTNRSRLAAARRAYFIRVEPLLAAMLKQLQGGSYAANPVEIISRLEGLIADQLKALFLGKVETKTWEGSLDVRSYPADTPVPLLCIDKTKGVNVKAERAPEAKPFPPEFAELDEDACKEANVAMTVSFHPKEEDQLFRKVANGTSRPSGDLSFRYRIPAQVKAVVTFKAAADPRAARATQTKAAQTAAPKLAVYGAGVFSVAHDTWGHVVELPAKRNAKTLSYDLGFIEATGGLKSFKLGSTGGLDASTVDAFGGVANSVLDARTARRDKDKAEREKEEAAAAAELDELEILTRRANILKLRDQICELQKKYGLSCDTQP